METLAMAETATKLPIKTEEKAAEPASTLQSWRLFESLRREMDRLFEDFDRGYLTSPFRRSFSAVEPFLRRELSWGAAPAVDVSEHDKAYEIKAELPGMEEKNIEVKIANGGLTIKGEKQEEKEEKEKDYHLKERRFGSFERFFRLPDGIDTSKIEANFKKGVLTVTLPKTPEAQKAEKKIEVKAA
jgi:HSP20 family protein